MWNLSGGKPKCYNVLSHSHLHSHFVNSCWGDGTFAWAEWAGLASVGENLRFLGVGLLVKRERSET